MKSTKVVLVGYGWWGRSTHVPLIQAAPGLELVGVVSGSEEKRGKVRSELGLKAYSTLDEALQDDEMEAVVITTPNNTHADLAIKALNAGRHVVVEKPMCPSLEEALAMQTAATGNGRVLEIFQNRRRDGDFLTVQHLAAQGELGEIRWIEMAWQGFGAYGGWRGQADSGGGKLYDLGAHLLDQIMLLIPSPVKSVYCRTHHDFADSEVESEAFIVLTFENGATGIADVSSLATISKPRFYVRGTEGTFQKFGLDPQEAALMKGDINLAVEDEAKFGVLANREGERTILTLPGRWKDFYENFARVVQGSAKPIVPLQDSVQLMRVLQAAQDSARQGEVIRLST